jgi:hypothetical protein
VQDQTYCHYSLTDAQESACVCCCRTGDADSQYSDYKDDGSNILLDANENAYGPGLELDSFRNLLNDNGHGKPPSPMDIDFLGLNRYPDPYVLDFLANHHSH